jgi:hypothetical protein
LSAARAQGMPPAGAVSLKPGIFPPILPEQAMHGDKET